MKLLLHRHTLHPPGESLAESRGDTEETAEKEEETGLRIQLILRSLELQLHEVTVPFVGCYSYLS